MEAIKLTEAWFQGALSVEAGEGWLKPWRLPHQQAGLFASPGNNLLARAEMPSGVRLRLETDATSLALSFLPLAPEPLKRMHYFDATLNNDLIASAPAPGGGTEAQFQDLPAGPKVLELWLPTSSPVALTALRVPAGCFARPAPDPRPRWVTYGSSLTHCVRAHSPARSWPAIVARRCNLHLTNLGFGGQCHLDPMVGLTIRDLPADVITMKLGINTVSGSVNERTYKALAIGLVRIIRERHRHTPMALISPIAYPPHETKPNVVGFTMPKMRADLQDAWQRLVAAGDTNLWYFDGLPLFNEELIAQYSSDQCHPNPDGIEVQAQLFLDQVCAKMPGFGLAPVAKA